MNSEPSRGHRKLWVIAGVAVLFLFLLACVGLFFGGRWFLRTVNAKGIQRREQVAQIETQRREFIENAQESVDSGKVPEGMADRLTKFSETIGNAADTTGGKEQKGLRVAQRMMQSLAPALATYEVALKELETAGSVDPTTLTSRQTIQGRVRLVNKFGGANKKLAEVLQGLEANLRRELDKEGITGNEQNQFVSLFLKNANVDLNRQIRDCDTELVAAMLKLLALFDREWEKWTIEAGSVAFFRDNATDEYRDLTAKLTDIAQRQGAAQQELLRQARAQQSSR